MLLAKALGTVTATVKHSSMEGWKLLLVQPLMADGETYDGDPLLAVDELGADRQSLVLITSDGRHVRDLLGSDQTPVRWSVIGIPD